MNAIEVRQCETVLKRKKVSYTVVKTRKKKPRRSQISQFGMAFLPPQNRLSKEKKRGRALSRNSRLLQPRAKLSARLCRTKQSKMLDGKRGRPAQTHTRTHNTDTVSGIDTYNIHALAHIEQHYRTDCATTTQRCVHMYTTAKSNGPGNAVCARGCVPLATWRTLVVVKGRLH